MARTVTMMPHSTVTYVDPIGHWVICSVRRAVLVFGDSNLRHHHNSYFAAPIHQYLAPDAHYLSPIPAPLGVRCPQGELKGSKEGAEAEVCPRLHTADYFGEIALILDRVRSVFAGGARVA